MIQPGVYLVGVAVVAFGVLGFFRGWRREIWPLGGLVIGWTVCLLAGRSLVDVVNRAYLMLAFTLGGGFDSRVDATVLLDQLRGRPLVSPSQPDLLLLCALGLIAVAAYALGSRYASGPESFSAQVYAVPLGLANGYLIVYGLLRFAGPTILGASVNATTRTVGQAIIPTLLVGAAAVCLLILQRLHLFSGFGGPRQSARARRQ